MSETIHQEISYDVDPQKLYETLLSSASFSAFTHAPAQIEPSEGGRFSCFDGQIVGTIIELVPGERVVQAWRVAAWDEGTYSVVKLTLEKTDAGTRLTLDHSGYPQGSGDHLAAGWPKMYWEPLRRHLEP